jgi:hypothetical protein
LVVRIEINLAFLQVLRLMIIVMIEDVRELNWFVIDSLRTLMQLNIPG